MALGGDELRLAVIYGFIVGVMSSSSSRALTIKVSPQTFGEYLLLPVTRNSTPAVSAHSRKRLSASSPETDRVFLGETLRLGDRIWSRVTCTCFEVNPHFGRDKTSAYSAIIAGEIRRGCLGDK